MVCRVWRGWTTVGNAESYDDYLRQELFPHLDRELRGLVDIVDISFCAKARRRSGVYDHALV